VTIQILSITTAASDGCLLAILGFVRREPRHGYAIYQQLNRSELRAIWRLKQSRLYAMLARLEDADFLRTTSESYAGRPSRKVFHLTEAGASAFEKWLEQPVAHPRDVRLEFMLKLYFALEAGNESATQLIARQRAVWAAWIEDIPAAEDSAFVQVVAAYRRAHILAIGNWLAGLQPQGGFPEAGRFPLKPDSGEIS